MIPTQIRTAYQSVDDGSRHFFDRKTMAWFGDRMTSFGARTIDGQVYLYRKADSRVNVFGNWKRAGRDFFNAWRFDPITSDLDYCDDDTTAMVWRTIYRVSP